MNLKHFSVVQALLSTRFAPTLSIFTPKCVNVALVASSPFGGGGVSSGSVSIRSTDGGINYLTSVFGLKDIARSTDETSPLLSENMQTYCDT